MPPRRRNPNPPAMPNEQFMEAMYAAIQGMATRAQNECPAEDRKQNYFYEYKHSSILAFTSVGGPQKAEYWFESVSKHLSTIGVPDEYWVEFITFKFEGPAGHGIHGPTAKGYDGEEYEAKFNELSHFVPSLIESERMKCLKFEKGLKGVIRKSVIALRHRVYSDLVAVAIFVEQEHIAFLQDREASGRTSGGPQRSNRKSRDQGQGSGGVPGGSSGSSGSGKSGPYSFKCHHCGELGHIKRNCPLRGQQYRPGNQRPNNNERGKGKAPGQMHTMAGGSSGAHVGNPVVEGMILISHSFARFLFDTGATHSFVSTSSVKVLGLKPDDLEISMFIKSPLGCVEFDVVLGMDWLSRYGPIVDCHRMRVTLTTSSGMIVTYQGEGESGITGENVELPVVDEYADVFPDELPG
ncbi:uncharacterized protein LOC112093831 [Morus notabilis]|uniref:uncharacterized protein LOC112093831 n=1 Tax=Morus notabilis TaxID=981085 RepID=UPI000CED6604|nr:uncharacterized protein LOC112093831 [Morus notabilis]